MDTIDKYGYSSEYLNNIGDLFCCSQPCVVTLYLYIPLLGHFSLKGDGTNSMYSTKSEVL